MEMQTLNINIDIPQGVTFDLASIKRKVTEYAQNLIFISLEKTEQPVDVEMAKAMDFIESLAVPGGKDIPVADDGVVALVEQ